MEKTATIELDAERSSLHVTSGRLFLGTRTKIALEGWEEAEGTRPVITLFAPGSARPLAQSTCTDGELVLDLTGAELRKAFRGLSAARAFAAYLNTQTTENDGDTWEWQPDVDAAGSVVVEWSPQVFELDGAAFSMATLEGPRGTDGADGKSAYELAVEQGFEGTLQEWLAQFDMKNALKGKTFDFTAANALKLADAIRLIFEALGGTVS